MTLGGRPTGVEKAIYAILMLALGLLLVLLLLCWATTLGAFVWCLIHPKLLLGVIPVLYLWWRFR